MAGDLGSSALADFIARWNLDDQAVDFLSSLDEAVRTTVLAEFAPRDGTQDVVGKLYAFAGSVSRKAEALTQLSQDVTAFAEKWGLDGGAVAWLTGLPEEVQAVLIEQFDPKEDTQNIIGKMRGFARSVQLRLPSAAGDAASPEGALALRVSEFAAKWGIEERALALIRSWPADVQATVVDQFDPKGDTQNVTGKLLAFARSRMAVRQSVEVDSFAQHWGLDEPTRSFLDGLPEGVKSIVMQQFDPAADTRDINSKLRVFARGILASGGAAHAGVGGHAGRLPEGVHANPNGIGTTSEAEAAAASTEIPAISEFVLRWGLDSGSVTLLESLPEDVRETVMSQFDPRDGTRNVGGKLHAFATTVLHGKGRGPARGAMPFQGASASQGSWAAPMMKREAPGGPEPGEEEAFLVKWGLSDQQTAIDVLARLQPPVRARVIREFLPGAETQNILAKFATFAGSVARAAAREVSARWTPAPQAAPAPLAAPGGWEARRRSGPYGTPAPQQQLPPAMNQFGGAFMPMQPAAAMPQFGGALLPLQAPVALNQFGAPAFMQSPVALNQFGAAVPVQSPVAMNQFGVAQQGAVESPEEFADRWQLDEGSRSLLRGLPPHVQAIVIAQFRPVAPVRDIGSKFCAFARSVAARTSDSGKRPLPTGSYAPAMHRPRLAI